MKCYLCQNQKIKYLFTKLSFEFFRCLGCGLIFLNPPQNLSSRLASYYEEGYFTGNPSFCAYADYLGDKPIILKNMHHYLSLISPFKKGGRLLDVGCATGIFLEAAQKAGFDPFGIDPSSFAISHLPPKFKDKVKKTTLSKAAFPEKFFDVITMWDIIEHLSQPRQDLGRLFRFLKDDGLLVISTNDTDSFWAKLWGKRWHFFVPPQHLFFYSPKTLKLLLGQTGFRVAQIKREGKWVSLRYLLHMMRSINQSRLADFAYHRVKKRFLGRIPLYLNLGDSLVVFAKKENLPQK